MRYTALREYGTAKLWRIPSTASAASPKIAPGTFDVSLGGERHEDAGVTRGRRRAPELVEEALRLGLIDEAAAKRYLRNYHHFRHHEPIIDALHAGKWVASLNRRIIVANTRRLLYARIRKLPHANRAYIRYMGYL